MKKKVLFIDHDDTVFASTIEVHYPSFVKVLERLRPYEKPITFEAFISHCQTYDFLDLCLNRYQFNPEEMEIEYQMWKEYTQDHHPKPFENIKDILIEFRNKGGMIVVVSHSESPQINRDYLNHFGFLPDLVFGFELGEEKRKPNVYPIFEGLSKLNLSVEDALVVDDSNLGKIMAQKLNMDFAWAAWSHSKNFSLKNASDLSFETTNAFYEYLFND